MSHPMGMEVSEWLEEKERAFRKPDGIPQDVWNRARECSESYTVRLIVASQIVAERERCAAFIREHQTFIAGEPADPMMEEILHSMESGQ